MKGICTVTKVFFGYLDALTPQYYDIALDNGFAQYGSMFVVTYSLYRYLPDMPWATLFGREYIDFFGRERILSTPAYHVEELDDDTIYIQLTEKMHDLHDDFDTVMVRREAAKQHLGYDCFYQKELLYHWDKNVNNKSKPPYRAPSFSIIDNVSVVQEKLERAKRYAERWEQVRRKTNSGQFRASRDESGEIR
jgi:hypothetical protein